MRQIQEFEAHLMLVGFDHLDSLLTPKLYRLDEKRAQGEDIIASTYLSKLGMVTQKSANQRDADRAKLLIHLQHDFGTHIPYQLMLLLIHEASGKIQADHDSFSVPRSMPWKNWSDFAYKNRLVLRNWAPNAPIPSVNFKDIKSGLWPEMLREMVAPRDRQAGLTDPIEDEDIDAGVRIE